MHNQAERLIVFSIFQKYISNMFLEALVDKEHRGLTLKDRLEIKHYINKEKNTEEPRTKLFLYLMCINPIQKKSYEYTLLTFYWDTNILNPKIFNTKLEELNKFLSNLELSKLDRFNLKTFVKNYNKFSPELDVKTNEVFDNYITTLV